MRRKILLTTLVTLLVTFTLIPITYTIKVPFEITGGFRDKFNLFLINHVLDTNDSLNIVVHSSGGSTYYAMQYINSILKKKPAKVTTFVDSIALSGGAWISSVGDEMVCTTPYSLLLFHQSRTISLEYDPSTRTTRQKINIDKNSFYNKIIGRYMERVVYDKLTKQEISDYNSGKDIKILCSDYNSKTRNGISIRRSK